MIYVPPLAGTVPAGICNQLTSVQAWVNMMATYLTVPIPEVGGLHISDTAPVYDPAEPVAWLKLDGSGMPIRLYAYYDGGWIARHPLPQNAIIMTDQAVNTAVIGTSTYCDFDEGTLAVPTDRTGAFWEVVYGGRFPVGVGTTPLGVPLALGATGGEESHTLTVAEMPSHTHAIDSTSNGGNPGVLSDRLSIEPVDTTFLTDATGGGGAHNNMPQYIVLYILRRTARLFYVG